MSPTPPLHSPPRRLLLGGLAALALVLGPAAASAGTATLSGALIDSTTQQPVSHARLLLTRVADTTEVHQALSGDDGRFRVTGLTLGAYRLAAVRIGYAPRSLILHVARSDEDAGTIALAPAALMLQSVDVPGTPSPAVQRADTTEFNARAFKTNPDADAGDLIEKMPGIQIQNGTVKSNGENVQQVLVDGKPFFGQDPTIALKSLPADVIDKIQVFDNLSDQAEFTGFDDGQSIKTINVVLRPEARQGQFGKVYGGPGGDGRYLGGGSGNRLRGDKRLSVIALADNVNQQNFSSQDLLGVLNTSSQRGGAFGGGPNGGRAGGRGRGAGGGGFGGGFGGGGFGGGGFGGPGGGGGGGAANFLVGAQNGITTTTSIGTNYSTDWGKKLAVTQSYFFNATDNRDMQNLARDYAVPIDSVTHYGQGSTARNHNQNHRYDARFEETFSPSTSLIQEPRLYFQSNGATNASTGSNADALDQELSRATSGSSGSTTGDNLSDHVVARHRFARRGRTVSLDFGLGWSQKNGTSALSTTDAIDSGDSTTTDTLDRHTRLHTTTGTASARLVYTEPLGGKAQLQVNLAPRLSNSRSHNDAFLPDSMSGGYTIPDTTQSNSFTSTSAAQSAGLGLRVHTSKMNLASNLAWQASSLHDVQSVPMPATVDRRFGDFLPSVTMNLNLASERNLRLSYFTSTRAPSIGQLQNVVDISNPLALTTGNPGLRETYVQSLVCRLSATKAASGRSVFLLLSAQRVGGYIANTTVTASNDSVLAGGTVLRQGSQLTYPVNLDGYWSANSFLTYSHPVAKKKIVLNLNGGATWSRTPGLIGTLGNLADTWALSEGAVVSSNISPNLDFILSYSGSYNITSNSLPGAANSDYYSHTAGLKLNAIVWNGLVVRNEVSQVFTNGLTGGYDQNIVLWNVSLGQKLLQDRSAELRLTAADVLDQNRSVSRIVTSSYVQNTENLALRPYVMLQVTCTLR